MRAEYYSDRHLFGSSRLLTPKVYTPVMRFAGYRTQFSQNGGGSNKRQPLYRFIMTNNSKRTK